MLKKKKSLEEVIKLLLSAKADGIKNEFVKIEEVYRLVEAIIALKQSQTNLAVSLEAAKLEKDEVASSYKVLMNQHCESKQLKNCEISRLSNEMDRMSQHNADDVLVYQRRIFKLEKELNFKTPEQKTLENLQAIKELEDSLGMNKKEFVL